MLSQSAPSLHAGSWSLQVLPFLQTPKGSGETQPLRQRGALLCWKPGSAGQLSILQQEPLCLLVTGLLLHHIKNRAKALQQVP